MKLVKTDSRPVSGDSGLFAIRDLAETYSVDDVQARLEFYSNGLVSEQAFIQGQSSVEINKLSATGQYSALDNMQAYVAHMLTYIDTRNISPLSW